MKTASWCVYRDLQTSAMPPRSSVYNAAVQPDWHLRCHRRLQSAIPPSARYLQAAMPPSSQIFSLQCLRAARSSGCNATVAPRYSRHRSTALPPYLQLQTRQSPNAMAPPRHPQPGPSQLREAPARCDVERAQCWRTSLQPTPRGRTRECRESAPGVRWINIPAAMPAPLPTILSRFSNGRSGQRCIQRQGEPAAARNGQLQASPLRAGDMHTRVQRPKCMGT